MTITQVYVFIANSRHTVKVSTKIVQLTESLEEIEKTIEDIKQEACQPSPLNWTRLALYEAMDLKKDLLKQLEKARNEPKHESA